MRPVLTLSPIVNPRWLVGHRAKFGSCEPNGERMQRMHGYEKRQTSGQLPS